MTSSFQHLDTTQLRCGDVVLNHGMRIELDQPPAVYDNNPSGRRTFAFSGKVLNPGDVREDGLLWSFLHTDEWDDKLRRWVTVYTGRFTIQGNDLARWTVESRCGMRSRGMHPDARCLLHGDHCAPLVDDRARGEADDAARDAHAELAAS